jgi:uncharacterized protein YndB with AHSA1/START domain
MTERTKSELTITLPSDREIVMTREFDAPRELVFRAMTDPEAIPRWWGPRYLTTTVDKLEFRPGGVWRFIQRDPQGNEHAFNGVYREIVPPERVVNTFEYEGMPGHILVESIVLEDLGGRTRVTSTSLFDSAEDRDGMMQSGMESGARESYERLTEYLESIA